MIAWVSFFPILRTPAGGLTSPTASVRYRALIPAAELGRAGSECRVLAIGPNVNRRTLKERFKGVKTAIFTKLIAGTHEMGAQLAADLHAAGVRIVADFCDDKFTEDTVGPATVALAKTADLATASAQGLADEVRRYTAAPVHVVDDPVEGRKGEPRSAAASPLRLLWFGAHPHTLQLGMPEIAASGIPFELTVIGAAQAEPVARQHGARYVPWSVEATQRGLAECDVVILPSDTHDPLKVMKSANRMNDGIWAGRFVLAHPLPAYAELADFGWVGEDLRDGMRWYAGHASDAEARIRAGQDYISQRFTPAAVAKAWAAVLG